MRSEQASASTGRSEPARVHGAGQPVADAADSRGHAIDVLQQLGKLAAVEFDGVAVAESISSRGGLLRDGMEAGADEGEELGHGGGLLGGAVVSCTLFALSGAGLLQFGHSAWQNLRSKTLVPGGG
jgi:hypothetical protein